MISITQPDEPFDIDISGDIVFTVRPLDTFSMALAQEQARANLARLENSCADVQSIGLVAARDINLADEGERSAYYYRFLIAALAENHIIGWTGVDCDVGVENARSLVVGLYPIGDIFYHQFTKAHLERLKAKKDCGTAAHGISAAVPHIATDVENPEVPAPMGSQD